MCLLALPIIISNTQIGMAITIIQAKIGEKLINNSNNIISITIVAITTNVHFPNHDEGLWYSQKVGSVIFYHHTQITNYNKKKSIMDLFKDNMQNLERIKDKRA